MPKNSRSRQPSVQHAADFIKRGLTQGVWKQGECLPSTRKLAVVASVSKATMLKAINRLASEGHVWATERRRVIAGPKGTLITPLQECRLPRQRAGAAFEQDVLAGAFGFREALPNLKELQGRYGVSHETMRRILRTMAAEGIVKPHGRGYVRNLRSQSSFAQIVFITMQAHLTQSSALNNEHNRIANIFETECLNLGIRLKIVEIDFFDAAKVRRAASLLSDDRSLVGFILDIWWYNYAQYRDSYLTILERLTRFKKPLALLDELGYFELPAHHDANPLIQLYTIESRKAGLRMARYLIGKGHKACAYISTFRQERWSRERYVGVAEQFSRIDGVNRAHLVTGEVEEPFFYLMSMSGLTDEEIHHVMVFDQTEAQLENTWSGWKAYKKSNPPPLLTNRGDAAELKRSLGLLPTIMRSGVADDILAGPCASANATGANCFRQFLLKPLFKTALSFPDATAWVCANDWIAFDAIAFLEARGIAPGKQISVAGFDNTPSRALERQLTSYDFNAGGFVKHILGFILRPPRPKGHFHHTAIEIEGMIIERESTGKTR